MSTNHRVQSPHPPVSSGKTLHPKFLLIGQSTVYVNTKSSEYYHANSMFQVQAEHRGPASVSRLASAASFMLHIQRLIYQLLRYQLTKNIQSYSHGDGTRWHGDRRQSYEQRISRKILPLSAHPHADGKSGEVSQSPQTLPRSPKGHNLHAFSERIITVAARLKELSHGCMHSTTIRGCR